jgi:hypothetical protein
MQCEKTKAKPQDGHAANAAANWLERLTVQKCHQRTPALASSSSSAFASFRSRVSKPSVNQP